MDELEQYTKTQSLQEIIRLIHQQGGCGVSSEVARQHGDALIEIKTKLGYLIDGQQELKREFQAARSDLYERTGDHSEKITKLETEKKTMAAIITSIISTAIAIASVVYKR